MEIISVAGSRRTAYGWASGDNPGSPDFAHAVPGDIAAEISRSCENLLPHLGTARHVSALQPCEHIVGRFRVVLERGERFVRISSLLGYPLLEQSITRYLDDAGVPVALLEVAGHRLSWNGSSYRLDVRPFLQCRHFDGGDQDLIRTAEVLRDSHRALQTFPEAEEIRRLAVERNDRLETQRKNLARRVVASELEAISPHPAWARRNAVWLADLSKNFRPDYHRQPGAQALHGQPHRANVVFRLEDAQPVLLDFEDAVAVWAPVSWDLAYFVQRFCLQGVSDETESLRRMRLVAKHYGPFGSEMFQMMRQIAWLSVVILADAWITSQVEAPVTEFEKFVSLETQARAAEALWDQ